MLKDSDSPHNALESLSRWRALPETQEVLLQLKVLADKADRQSKASPFSYRVILTENINGVSIQRQVLPDGQTAEQMRHQFIGNFQGLSELSRLLDQRQEELTGIIEQQKQDEEDKRQEQQ